MNEPLHKVVDNFTITFDEATSLRMAGVRRHGTAPELLVRQILHRAGLRFRTNNRDLPGSPDIANRSRRWAVFVHGCYWHRHQNCPRATTPKRNTKFWLAKFEANVARDARAVRELRTRGYRVITVWECEIADVSRASRKLRPLAATRERKGAPPARSR